VSVVVERRQGRSGVVCFGTFKRREMGKFEHVVGFYAW